MKAESKKRVVLFQNHTGIQVQRSATDALPKFQELILEAEKFKIKIASIDQLKLIVEGGFDVIRNMIYDSLPQESIGKYSVSKDNLMTMLDLPSSDNVNHLISEVRFNSNLLRAMSLKNGKLYVDNEKIEAIDEAGDIVAKTQAQVKAFEGHSEMAKILNTFNEAYSITENTVLKDLFLVDDKGRFSIKNYYYATHTPKA
ncbi:MAG TPA: hypothetical protein PKL31_04120 [Fulvivirga sp.]|nr:hypothetical protein [Fulvivirga sp.]